MCTWRRMMTIRWTERKSNGEILNIVQGPRQIIKIIETRKITFFEHVMRHNKFIVNVIEGKINGKIGRGQPKETNLGNIKKKQSILPRHEAMKISAWKKQE